MVIILLHGTLLHGPPMLHSSYCIWFITVSSLSRQKPSDGVRCYYRSDDCIRLDREFSSTRVERKVINNISFYFLNVYIYMVRYYRQKLFEKVLSLNYKFVDRVEKCALKLEYKS